MRLTPTNYNTKSSSLALLIYTSSLGAFNLINTDNLDDEERAFIKILSLSSNSKGTALAPQPKSAINKVQITDCYIYLSACYQYLRSHLIMYRRKMIFSMPSYQRSQLPPSRIGVRREQQRNLLYQLLARLHQCTSVYLKLINLYHMLTFPLHLHLSK